MAYTINKTNGDILATIVDGTVNESSSSIALIGRNAINFGEKQNENFVKLLENFSANTAPTNAITGQLWFQSNTQILNYYTGAEWKGVAITSSDTAPTGPVASELWWDTTNTQLKLYSGTEWLAVAPEYTSAQGKTGALVETIYDTSDAPHYCVVLYSAGTRIAIVNKDTEFTPNVSLTGFSKIDSGLTISSNNSLSLGSIAVTAVGDDTVVTSKVSNADITFKSNVNGTSTTVLQLDGTTGQLIATVVPTTGSSLTNKDYVDTAISTYADSAIADAISAIPPAPVQSVAGKTGTVTLAVGDISGAAPLANPIFTGNPTAPTQTIGDNSTKLSTTEFVNSSITQRLSTYTTKVYVDALVSDATNYTDTAIGNLPGAPVTSVAGRTGTIVLSVTDISGAAPTNSPVLTGSPTTTTPATGDISSRVASTSFVKSAIAASTNSKWQGSTKYVSTSSPTSGDGSDGDFWFKV